MRRKQFHPFVHVMVFGVLFAIVLLILLGPPTSPEASRQVILDESDIAQLRAIWMRQWKREPTPEELRGNIEQFVREEVLYREAVARGFDRDDMLIRRAMQRKMEFLGEAQLVREDPTDEEIQSYLSLRQERYRIPAEISFAQIYFNVDRRKEQAETDALRTLSEIRETPPEPALLETLGDASLLETFYRDLTEQQIRSAFGEDFIKALLEVTPETWYGPLRSGYGLHLIYVSERQDSSIPEWRTIKPAILDDMEREARKAAKDLFYTEILRQYQIVYRDEVLNLFEEERTE